MSRIVVIGAGAIGGAVGARLFEADVDVMLVARGAHAAAIAADGLTLVEPDREITLPVPVVTSVAEAAIDDETVVALGVKTQDTPPVLGELAVAAPAPTPVFCFQNGVANERLVAETFPNTYGVVVMMPAAHLEPGRVEAYASPIPGLFDVGLAAGGTDPTTAALVADLARAGFDARAVPDVMRWKYTKLLMNLGNAVEAICVRDADAGELVRRARREARATFAAAGIDHASAEEEAARRGDLLQVREIHGAHRGGGSSWQSIARGLGTIEADAFNGEVVRVGAAHGVATPVNAVIRDRAVAAAAARIAPNSVPAGELLAALE
jgi:2-dehydropantoate 2-reductase